MSSVTEAELTAYADGEITGADADRIAAAIAADPALAARLDAEKQLRALLRGHLDPVAAEPVPESLTLMIAAAAAEDAEHAMTDAPAPPSPPARILDFAAARARKQSETKTPSAAPRPLPRWWVTGVAIAASLVLGVGLGVKLPREGAGLSSDGAFVASGSLAHGLNTRLASMDAPKGMRILTSFRRGSGDYCRVYEAGANSGIACKEGSDWVLERTMASGPREAGQYRQAGSAQAELMAAAQDMASGEPLDAAQERAAKSANWAKN